MKPLNNERGMVAMLVAVSIVAVGALVILQTSIAFNANQDHESSTRLKGNAHLLLLSIAQRIKRGHDLATFRPDCSGFGVPLKIKELPGHTAASPKLACVKDANKVCTTNPAITGDDTPICAPLENNKINWQIDASDTGRRVRFGRLSGTGRGGARAKTVRITIPDRTDPLWKDCTDNTCVRVTLCPPGSGACRDSEVQAAQIIMLNGN